MHPEVVELYAAFLQILLQHPEIVVWNNGHINDGKLFYQATKQEILGLLQTRDHASFVADFKAACDAGSFPAHLHSFKAAFLGACAACALEQENSSFALDLAEQGISFNAHDLFVQDILLRARSNLKLNGYSYEESEDWLKAHFCTRPFTMIETTSSREFYRCCPAWLPVPIGNFDAPDLDSVVNSAPSKALQESMLDGSFRYCSKLFCPAIAGRNLPTREEGLAKIANCGSFPEEVALSHDRTCNLSCPSCRRNKITIPKDQQEQFDTLSAPFLVPLMEHAHRVHVSGSGDPFASIHFRNLIRAHCQKTQPPVRKIELFTNGVLCDEKAWADLHLKGHVKKVMVSIDAASASTYAIVRRDGDFERLLTNLEFLARLRREGEYDELFTLFVVQNQNFREMPAFIELSERYNVDSIIFSQLRNWGTFTPEEFLTHTVTTRTHPNHQEFLDILKSPVFDRPTVWLGDLNIFRTRIDAHGDAALVA